MIIVHYFILTLQVGLLTSRALTIWLSMQLARFRLLALTFCSLVPVLIPADVGSRNCLAREAAHMEEIPDKQDVPCGTNDLPRTDQINKETHSDASSAGNLFSSSTKINTCLEADIDVAVGAYSNKVMDDVESTRL